MAEKDRMTSEEVVRWLLASDGADPVRESLRWMAEQLMEAEVSDLVGAEQRTEDRTTHRNGYRPRPGTPAPASSSSRSRSCARAATSRASSSRASGPSRRS